MIKSLVDLYKANKPADYVEKYEQVFKPYQRANTVLEIGVNTGGSLRVWRDYFFQAKIIGLDIVIKADPSEGIVLVEGDQTDGVCLAEIIEEHGPFDLIIDDGSHRPKDFEFTFNFLFPAIRPGGLYVIEDMGAIHHPAGWAWIKEDGMALLDVMGGIVREYYGKNKNRIERMDLGRHVSFFWKAW